MKKLLLFAFIFILSFNGIAQEFPEPMKPKRMVNDLAAVFTPQEANALEQKLRIFNDTSSTQIAIASVASLHGYDANDYAQRLAEKWGIGQKGKDNGILILIKPKTRTSRGEVAISVGYGLEGVVPDALAARIIDNEIIPSFKRGAFYAGINQATNVLIKLSGGEFTAQQYAKKGGKGRDTGKWVLLPFLIVFLVPLFVRRRTGYTTSSHSSGSVTPIFFGGLGGGGRSSGFSSFSSGGGSFGGFGGGGFGGGGASGSW